MHQSRIHAPGFPGDLQWLNTERPLALADLRGKVVLLDFWTYCCINCMHILPDLKRLEREFAGELVVIGVHSAKFTTEQSTENIRQAVLRYGIEHPVVNDSEMQIWRRYGVGAWPTTVLIDPEGYVVGARSGEGVYEPMSAAIRRVVDEWDRKGALDRSPLALVLERDAAAESLLYFPGKVLADERSDRLFIADSGHNRIVIARLSDFQVLDVAGGKAGFEDGDLSAAAFSNPQGMAWDGRRLYVADTDNHAVRRVDLERGAVETIAGDGRQARFGAAGGPGAGTSLNSPWDLALAGDGLFIAMAGSHQIWRLDLKTLGVSVHAGSGREARVDGPLSSAALAQPSGLAGDGAKLFFADSEVSSIRSADIDPKGAVETIVGGDLFDFGDADGAGLSARLQHPLGVAYDDGKLYVADTYNNKIKVASPAARRIRTLAGSGEAGLLDGAAVQARFDEPGGVSIAGRRLFVADTNNHAVRVVDLETLRVATVSLKGLGKMRPSPEAPGENVRTDVGTWSVEPGGIRVLVTLSLPEGYKLTDGAPSSATLLWGGDRARTVDLAALPAELSLDVFDVDATVNIDYVAYYCREGADGLCFFYEGRLELVLKPVPGAGRRSLTLPLEVGQER